VKNEKIRKEEGGDSLPLTNDEKSTVTQ